MSDSLTAEILSLLASRSGMNVIVTVGNTLRSDDGVGPYIASRLKSSPYLSYSTTPTPHPKGRGQKSPPGVSPGQSFVRRNVERLAIIDAGSNPENIVEEVVALRPRGILIVDAADFGGTAGEVRVVDKEHIPETALSTHMISLKVIARILSDDARAPVFFLGIQPKHAGIGERLSPEVKKAADEIVTVLEKNYGTARAKLKVP